MDTQTDAPGFAPAHPEPAQPSPTPRGPLSHPGEAGRRKWPTDRDRWIRCAPGLASAAVCAEGFALSGRPWIAGGIVAAITAAGYGLAWWRGSSPLARLYGAAAGAYASAWAAEVAAHGSLLWHGCGYLVAGAWLVAVPWMYRHRWRWHADDPVAEPLPEPEEISPFRQIWLKWAQLPGSPYEDCDLSPEWEVPGGSQADIIGPRGRKATEDLLQGVKVLRSAWETDASRLFLEPTPDGKGTTARLTVLERDVLADTVTWTGPTLDPATGIVGVGRFPDGLPAHGQFWSPRSGASDFFVSGTKGSGKSEFLALLVGELHLCPFTVPWVSDPQEGQCVPEFIDRIDRYAIGGDDDVEQNMRMLRALRRIVFRRSRFFGREIEWIDSKGRERRGGKKYFDPTETDVHGDRIPLLHAFLDEHHVLAQHPVHGKEAVALLGDISRLDRKTGVGKTYVAHTPSQTEMGGHRAAVIRNLLNEGTTVAFKSGEATDRTMLGLPYGLDPSRLPERFANGDKTHGLGILRGGPDGRCTIFRAAYNSDAYGVALQPAACQLDAMSAEAAAMPDDPERAPRHFPFTRPEFARPEMSAVVQMPTAAEQQTMAQRILPLLADGADYSYGAILKALPEAKERTVRYGLKQLVSDDLVATDGHKKPYRITDAGRADLERRGVAA